MFIHTPRRSVMAHTSEYETLLDLLQTTLKQLIVEALKTEPIKSHTVQIRIRLGGGLEYCFDHSTNGAGRQEAIAKRDRRLDPLHDMILDKVRSSPGNKVVEETHLRLRQIERHFWWDII